MPGDGPMPDVPAHDDPAMNTMFAGFLAQARLRPSAEAVVLGAARIDYARLRTRGLAIAQAVAALPPPGAAARAIRPARLRPLKVVALILDNRLEFVEAFIGTVMAGAVVLVVDPKLTPEQGQGLLDSLRPDLLIHDPAVAPWSGSHDAGAAAGGVLVVTGGADCAYRRWRDRATARLGPGDGPARIDPSTPFLIATTSGTSSAPKAFIRDHASWAESFRNSIAEFGVMPGERVLALGPLVHGLSLYATMEALAAGATAVLMQRFDAARAAEVASAERADVMVGVPTMFDTLAQGLEAAGSRISSVRAIVSAGAKLPPAMAAILRAALPRAEIQEYYGASELSFVTLARSGRGDPPESVGRAFHGVSLRIVDPDGLPLSAGEVGRIDVRSRMVSSGYILGGEDGSGFLALDGGWYTVGDLGRLDDQGRLYILGRAGGMIITGGLNVYPGEVEAAVLSVPGIAEALVFGAPDPHWGQQVAVVLRGEGEAAADLHVLRAALDGRLARHKQPRLLWRIGDWPLATSGKIARGRVLDMLGAGKLGAPQRLHEPMAPGAARERA
ncbi:class I adenylate-forming enzyme family protein [Tistrella sp. BH-R2-4]|uniref:Class I adenylate-forming enzyme family protein n=1 Tax=Tistrella arctica TaxID=3133430 RepID=A0ABU9YDW2_9PROT